MIPPHSRIQPYAGPINTEPPVAASSAQTRPHPEKLSLADLSPNARLALKLLEGQVNKRHKVMALLVQNGIVDGTLRIHKAPGTKPHYMQKVNLKQEKDFAHLTVRTSLNDWAQYDITGIDLHVPSWDRTESIALSAPPPATTHHEAASDMDGQASMAAGNLAAHASRAQLTQALMMQNSYQYFSGAPLPLDASVGTQSMVFSHGGSAVNAPGVPGPSKKPPAHAARSEPFAGSPQSDATPLVLKGANSKRVEDPDNPGKFVTLGTLRSRQKVKDPKTGEMVSIATLRNRQKVKDPETGDIVTKTALRQRRKVLDSETGEMVSAPTLRNRQKVKDPKTGQTLSKAALTKREERRAKAETA